ncbi:DUF3175 domain-containing protein [Ralstonia holmesii]|uniref:DUF3175 domain-containing protein n=1 Tax=Ralstonia holmesii TaxID=3058602 RepID=A0ABC8Q5D5_9RALS|nr:DUF3175 domain-containing protein [Ralstonia sp. LMG 32967]CAJ0774870.1 hypothetical protein LMG18096_00319 [Ralstonia sp. LMG 32967]CAJ0814577.1 hypothetical protein LMG18093_02392 [Ralstonia sp. LMG 32967]
MATHHASSKPAPAKSKAKPKPQRWSHQVMETSDALDIEPDIFKSRSPARIAASLKASAEHSRRRKGTAFQSAMSMLTFYINRAGHNLSAGRRRILERAKDALRAEFGRPAHSSAKARH